jgi:hypothetical protein
MISTTKLEERKPVASTNEHAKQPEVQHTQSDGRYSHSRHARSSFLPSSEESRPLDPEPGAKISLLYAVQGGIEIQGP